jgi:hypothetical protein
MAEIISREDLRGMDLPSLKKYAKKLKKAGYPIAENLEEIAMTKDDPEKYLRMKIRHAQRVEPVGETKSEKYLELEALPKKSKISGQNDLETEARKYGVSGYREMNKDELIREILKNIEAGVEPSQVKKRKSPKSKSKDTENEDTDVEDTDMESKRRLKMKPASHAKSKSVQSSSESEREVELAGVKIKGKKTAVHTLRRKVGKPAPSDDELKSAKKARVKELEKIINGRKELGSESRKNMAKKLLKNFNKYGESCSEDNDFKCGDDRVCDMSVDPGVCIDPKDRLKDNIQYLQYKGTQIIGDAGAIKALKRRLGVENPGLGDPTRDKLIRKAVKISAKDEYDFRNMNSNQLRLFIDNFNITENGDDESGEEIEIDTELPDVEIARRAKLVKKQMKLEKGASSENREELIEALSALLDREPSYFKKWTNLELKQRLESFAEPEDFEKPSTRIKDTERKQNIDILLKMRGGKPSNYKKWSDNELRQRVEGLMEETETKSESKSKPSEEKDSESESEESEEEKVPKKKAKEVSSDNVVKVLSDVISGKGSKKSEEFSEIQKTVLKCLGLLS